LIEGAREEGERTKAVEIARNLLAMGMEISLIAKASGLTEAEIQKIILTQ
jgi:predicted transposase YdaD